MLAYHEVSPQAVASVRRDGLKRKSRGDKGDDKAIIATDAWLDAHRPEFLAEKGVSRDDNLYAYVRIDDAVIDIVSGLSVPLDQFVSQRQGAVLELTLDPERCYVSDLDAYDALKNVIFHEDNRRVLTTLAHVYWSKIRRLDQYSRAAIQRPEIMIPYDLPPTQIRILK